MNTDTTERVRLPRALYEEADRLDSLGRAQGIDTAFRHRLLDITEQLRELARLEMRLGIPY